MATTSDQAAIDEVLEAEEARCRAIEQTDWAALDRILGDDFVYTHSTGKHETKDEWVAGIKKLDRAVVRDNLSVRVFGDVALVSGTSVNRYAEPFNGDSHFGSLLDVLQVWVKRDGEWQLVANHGVKLPTD
ncbi:MAG: nuclear transport factor 2 family protein [Acidimicrobiaceae bacterium]|nr:nuclear transport factor 2 family protein [Acidimicrobiaceae bacterium]MBO0713957.1 nuclear transport factor 2 family protein [Acidimicrobiales bacterium]MBO0886317.1 nuclear transport factor 2 family protein [Acidimicrobiales bacterium]